MPWRVLRELAKFLKSRSLQVILQVEEPPDRSDRTPPALVFRVEANQAVGKLCMAKVADDLAALREEPVKAQTSALARIGTWLGKANARSQSVTPDAPKDKDNEKEKEGEKDEAAVLVTQRVTRPE